MLRNLKKLFKNWESFNKVWDVFNNLPLKKIWKIGQTCE